MIESKYASIDSQLGNSNCEVEDTEEMRRLRELDDYQSYVSLGNALSRQYRFKEAITEYKKASSIKSDDPMLHICHGGANLSLLQFDEAKLNYDKALACGASKYSLSFPMGIWYYLKDEYSLAADCFLKCLPCDGEMKIAVIYWHTLSSYKGGLRTMLLKEYKSSMDVGHHIAYKQAVSVFTGESMWNHVALMDNELDTVILKYGLSVYLEYIGQFEKAIRCKDEVLKCNSVWPCVSYLAAWNEKLGNNEE